MSFSTKEINEQLNIISSQILFNLLQELKERGVSLEQLSEWSSIVQPVLRMDRVRIPFSQAQFLIKQAERITNDDDLGLAVGHRQSFAASGVLAAAMLACETCMDALRIGVKYNRLAGSMLDLHLQQKPNGDVSLTTSSRHPESEISRFLTQEFFASAANISYYLCDRKKVINRVSFVFKSRAATRYREAFRCPVRFAQSQNEMLFNADALGMRLHTADTYALNSLIPLLDELSTQEYSQQSLLTHLEELLLAQLTERPTMASVASELSISERSLRRKLRDAGTNYRDLLDRVRQTKAIELLQYSDLPLEDIAFAVGFEESRSLRRRVRHWTGKGARALRQQTG